MRRITQQQHETHTWGNYPVQLGWPAIATRWLRPLLGYRQTMARPCRSLLRIRLDYTVEERRHQSSNISLRTLVQQFRLANTHTIRQRPTVLVRVLKLQTCTRNNELSSPYNPESKGLAEANVKSLKSIVIRRTKLGEKNTPHHRNVAKYKQAGRILSCPTLLRQISEAGLAPTRCHLLERTNTTEQKDKEATRLQNYANECGSHHVELQGKGVDPAPLNKILIQRSNDNQKQTWRPSIRARRRQ